MGAKTSYNDQLIVRVGKACNFKCNFCNVSTNERNVKLKENINDIVRNFHYKLKYSKINSGGNILVTISGGEPSLFKKETIFAIKYIKNFLNKKGINVNFDIQTNGSLLDENFVLQLKNNGVSAALVSFHIIDKKIYEKVLGVSYDNFIKTIYGINLLNKYGIEVITNSILSNENKGNFYETIKFINKELSFIKFLNIGTVQPNGDALININTVIPFYEEISEEYNKVMFYLKKENKDFISHYVGPPACYIYSKQDSLEIVRNTEFRKNLNFSEKYLLNNINDKNKSQTKDCEKCLYNNVCSGIWKEYVGLQKLKPLNYIIDKNNNFGKNNFAYRLKNKEENLKKIYDGNFRQIIIPSSIGTEKEVYNLLKESTKKGFYKVSLLINSDFEFKKDIVYTGVSNIQLKQENISEEVLYFIKDFSKKYSPQFKIDIDFI